MRDAEWYAYQRAQSYAEDLERQERYAHREQEEAYILTKARLSQATHQVISHGFQHPDYFHGCGVCFTPYQFVVTGCGPSGLDALEDALNQAAELNAPKEVIDAAQTFQPLDNQTLDNGKLSYLSIRW